MPPRTQTEAERFWSKVNRSDGCWPYGGTPRKDGYRQIGVGSMKDGTRRGELAHRFSYVLANGSVPEGLTVDHQCHNDDLACPGGPACPHRSCVRPDHLIARPIGDNVRRAAQSRKTQCPAGHPYDEANTYRYANRSRGCRACNRNSSSKRRTAFPERIREINQRAEAKRRAKRKAQREVASL